MANLATEHLGLLLKNPLIAGSSTITDSVSKVVKLEEAGVGAVVLKSLFEEQIFQEANAMIRSNIDISSETADYLYSYMRNNATSEYLDMISECKKLVSIPIIASINCVTTSAWIDLAREIESVGADAIEINVYYLPNNKQSSAYYEKMYFDIAERLNKSIRIPFSFKLGYNFTNIIYLVDQLYLRGASNVVLFNRFFEPDVDIRTLDVQTEDPITLPGEMGHSLRWVSLTSAQVPKIQITAATGIRTGWDVLKQILVGATATQISSVLARNGFDHVSRMLGDMTEWMDKNGFETLNDFRGLVRDRDKENMQSMSRLQYMNFMTK